MWDRELIESAQQKGHNRQDYRIQRIYDEIFVGHTTTGHFKTYEPVKFCEINDIDTGGGWEGKLTIMNLCTREYFQSDSVKILYPYGHDRKEYKNQYIYDIMFNSQLFHNHP